MAARLKMTCGLYAIYGPNKTIYVGQSIHIEDRWREHLYQLERGKHHCKLLQQAYQHYGSSRFGKMVLHAIDLSTTNILNAEKSAIEWYRRNSYQILNSAYNRSGILNLVGKPYVKLAIITVPDQKQTAQFQRMKRELLGEWSHKKIYSAPKQPIDARQFIGRTILIPYGPHRGQHARIKQINDNIAVVKLLDYPEKTYKSLLISDLT